MNHCVKIVIALCACIALTSAQFGHFGINFADFGSSFGAPSYNTFAAASRDPRANTGPVLFPPSPSGDPGQTSGVIVGASGYGFVPPGSQGRPISLFCQRICHYLNPEPDKSQMCYKTCLHEEHNKWDKIKYDI